MHGRGGAVYDLTPVIRAPADIIASGEGREPMSTPGAQNARQVACRQHGQRHRRRALGRRSRPTHPRRDSGVVAAAIRRKATTNKLSRNKRKGADTCADYLISQGPYLSYAHALSSGWPIATGIIEGACRHFVKRSHRRHRRTLGATRRPSSPRAARARQQWRLRRVLALPLTRERLRVHCSRCLGGHIPGATMAA
jgi:hypothetical protein